MCLSSDGGNVCGIGTAPFVMRGAERSLRVHTRRRRRTCTDEIELPEVNDDVCNAVVERRGTDDTTEVDDTNAIAAMGRNFAVNRFVQNGVVYNVEV